MELAQELDLEDIVLITRFFLIRWKLSSCVCVKCITLCNCLCSSSAAASSRDSSSTLSEISGNSEQNLFYRPPSS